MTRFALAPLLKQPMVRTAGTNKHLSYIAFTTLQR